MSCTKTLVSLCAFFLIGSIAGAQTTTSVSTAQDAPTVLASSLATAGASLTALNDTVSEVQITSYGKNGATTSRSRIKTLGYDKIRFDPEASSTPILVINGSVANVIDGSDVQVYSSRSIGPVGISFLPWLGISRDLSDPRSSKNYVKLESGLSGSSHRIRVTRPAADPVSAPEQYDVLVDASSYLINSVSFIREAPAGANLTVAVEFRFAAFQKINGVLVPTAITEFIRGQKAVEIQLLSFAVNQGTQLADFEVKAQ